MKQGMCAQLTARDCPRTMDEPERAFCRNCVLFIVARSSRWWLTPVNAKRLPIDSAQPTADLTSLAAS
jgi:hypothetical protein